MADGNSISNQSGGVDVNAEQVNIGGDVVGRDKIVQTELIDTGGGAVVKGDVNVDPGGIFIGRDSFTVINNFAFGDSKESPARDTELILLQKVRQFWLEGVLEKSIYNEVMIKLGVETQPSAVEHPWDMVLETPNKEPQILPKNQKISDIFREMDHALLILGEPGSGKTITLLELARETILLAEKDSTQPIPVVFNLSSWAKRKLPVQVWLVEELTSKYQIPSWIGRIWVKQDRLMLGSFGVSRSYQHCQE